MAARPHHGEPADLAGSPRVLAFASSGTIAALGLLTGADPSPALYLAYDKAAQLEAQWGRLNEPSRCVSIGSGESAILSSFSIYGTTGCGDHDAPEAALPA